jgi:hypothetical protein
MIEVLDRRARDLGINDFALSLRQVDRWFAGHVATAPRPSVCRVVEAEFGYPVNELLSPDFRRRRGIQEERGTTTRDLRTTDFVSWIADHSDHDFAEVYGAVSAMADSLTEQPLATRAAREHTLARIGRAGIARALELYYGAASSFYRASINGAPITLGVLADPRWLEVAVPMDTDHENFLFDYSSQPPATELTPAATQAAITRLAAIEVGQTVLHDNPLYRLLRIDIDHAHVSAALGLTSFASYALTADLLEAELLDSLADTVEGSARSLPLRNLYLPTAESALSFQDRVCAGGPACLTAVARPDDYLLIIQERSPHVLNMTGKLAVIPKAFHQPITDLAETQLSASIERELEEELLGRKDLERLSCESGRRAAPRHPLTLSEPMRWLLDHRYSYQVQCTGFGVNMLTGTYEFPCLILIRINDAHWWSAYGDRVEANWETMRLRCYSSRDTDGIAALIADPQWSNEGLFAFIQGLRRLDQITPDKASD